MRQRRPRFRPSRPRHDLAALTHRITQLEKQMTEIVDQVHAATAALKAQVDALQVKQATVEQMLADLIANPPSGGMDPDDVAKLTEARDILIAEAADVEADNADSPAA